jgi:hypothetical protein
VRLFEAHPHFVPDTGGPPPTELRVHGLAWREARREGAPCTVALHHIDNRLQHLSSIIRTGAAGPVWRQEQGGQSAPHHVDQRGRLRCCFLRVCRGPLPLPLAVGRITCPGVVPPAPPRPLEDACRTPFDPSHELPEQPADVGPAQADRSPRCALKRATLVVLRPDAPFLRATSVPVSTRMPAKNACAHMANVMWRYHPVHLRTS